MSYAWIVSTNDTYWPSVNAMLNALEYYGYRDLDVHIIHTPDARPMVEDARDRYSFRVIPIPVSALAMEGHSVPHNLVYSKYKHGSNIRNDYDVVFHIDGDCLVLDNFIKYFQIAAETDLIPCAQFPHTMMTVEDYKFKEPDAVHIYTPLANFPIFYNPRRYGDVMLDIWESQPDEKTCSDPLRNVEMYFFNKALFEHGYTEKILVLPGNLWVTDAFVHHTPIHILESGKKKALFNATMDRIQIIHNKWWKEGHAEGEIDRSPNQELCKDNIRKMLEMFYFFTEQQTATARI